jgi:hypothetical protein
MSGMEPMLIGAALGGGISAAKGGNPLTGALIGGATGGLGGSFVNGFTSTVPIVEASGAGGLANATVEAPTFMQQLASGATGVKDALGSANKFINQYPTTSQIGFNLAKDALTPEQPQYAPAGQIQRGGIQPVDYMSLLNPQGQSVMRPQPISLL